MTVKILTGDCRVVLKTLPSASVQCCVCSPPYWGLRDYGTAKWEGGQEGCDHRKVIDGAAAVATSTLGGGKKTTGHQQEGFGQSCHRCGATRIDSQIGLERTPEEYVEKIVGVFREVRRVLRDDGTLWLNLGDSYAGGKTGRDDADRKNGQGVRQQSTAKVGLYDNKQRAVPDGLKPKDLVGIPWLTAFALRQDGWYLRSEIIWAKPNPMPESVTDRPTKAHEQIFLLAKSATYYYDADAIAEPVAVDYGTVEQYRARIGKHEYHDGNSDPAGGGYRGQGGFARTAHAVPATRNARTVWTVATQPYSGAHFATFPPKLVEPCILAGTPPRACEHCGAPWARVVEKGELVSSGPNALAIKPRSVHRKPDAEPLSDRPKDGYGDLPRRERTTVGLAPSCACPNSLGSARSVVLDPFSGAGTTGLVADRLGRDAILIELNPQYAALGSNRITDDAPLFTDVEVA